MLSRLKSSVKGVVRAIRGESPPAPAARPAPTPVRSAPPVAARPADPPKPVAATPPAPPKPVVAAAAAPAKPVEAAPAPAKPVDAAPAPAKPVDAAPKVNGTKADTAPPKAEPAKAAPAPAAPATAEAPKAEPVKAEAVKVEAPKAEPPKAEPAKKPSLAALAAGAAKAPPPKPAAPAASDEDDHDEPAPKKATSLAAAAAAAASGAQTGGRMLRADMSSTDRAAYIARAIANNRDPNSIKGGEGMNVADDGSKYWGPLDNESSRAKAEARVLTVDQFECISCGTCVEQTNRVFYLPVDGKATPIAQDGPMDLIQDAIEACPVTCIHWVAPEEAEEKGYATGIGEDFSEVIASLPVD